MTQRLAIAVFVPRPLNAPQVSSVRRQRPAMFAVTLHTLQSSTTFTLDPPPTTPRPVQRVPSRHPNNIMRYQFPRCCSNKCTHIYGKRVRDHLASSAAASLSVDVAVAGPGMCGRSGKMRNFIMYTIMPSAVSDLRGRGVVVRPLAAHARSSK